MQITKPVNLLLVIAMFTTGAGYCAAQDMSKELQKCSAETSNEKRLSCFDRVMKQINGGDTRSAAIDETTIDKGAPTAAPVEGLPAQSNKPIETPPTKQLAVAVASRESTPESKVVARSNPLKSTDSEAVQTPISDTKPTVVAAGEDDAVETFGLPKPSARETFLADGEMHSIVKAISKGNRSRMRLELENGQVWERTESSRAGVPKVGDKVIIRRNSFGAFYLRKANMKRSHKVKRIS